MFEIIYYSLTSILAYAFFSKAKWYPREIGGQANDPNLLMYFPSAPLEEGSEYMLLFYLI